MWIETCTNYAIRIIISVTSLAEVWIETICYLLAYMLLLSLPLRKCGLKPGTGYYECSSCWVTSLAEVWIETAVETVSFLIGETSLPLRKCGLKQTVVTCNSKTGVTSLAEVWIETNRYHQKEHSKRVTSLAEVWIET